MKIFISWSGEVSHQVAKALRDWLPHVIQVADPFVSSEDIQSGSRWLLELSGNLQDYSIGIACLTPSNIDSRWLNFEAGALSKAMLSSRFMCLLIGMGRIDVQGPLAQFQLTTYDYDSVLKMIMDINDSGPEPPAKREVIQQTFAKYWPDLLEKLDPLVERAKNSPEGKELANVDVPAVLEELVSLARSQQNILFNRLPPNDPISVRISRETARSITKNWMTVEEFFNSSQANVVSQDVRNAATAIHNLIIQLVVDEASYLLPGKVEVVDVANWRNQDAEIQNWMGPEPARLRRIVLTDSSKDSAKSNNQSD